MRGRRAVASGGIVKLTVRAAAAMLSVSETKIYRWVDDDEIPFVMIHHHPMFHRVELLEWAMAMELPVRVDLYEGEHEQPFTIALERGGGRTLEGGLDDLAARLPIERASDRDVLSSVVSARRSELFVHRALGRIAVPKARSPIICPEAPPIVTLWWPGDRALVINHVPTSAVFVIVAPTIKQHLRLLGRLSLALHDPAFCTAVLRAGAFELVVAAARRWEQALAAAAPARQGAAP